ncbi:MAG: GntR family transcriptional regulator [Vulcanimicrobiaceae bacterium]
MAQTPSPAKAEGLRGRLERPRSLREQIYHRLRTAIFTGELAPGAPVIEADVAASLGVSRTPVREALRRLESEGMLEPRGARGTVVRELEREEVECMFDIREALETIAAQRASRRMSERDYAELERLLERMKKHVDDPTELEDLDTQFHARILSHADGKRLQKMLGDLRGDILLWRFIALGTHERRHEIVEEHSAMVAAMRSHDDAAVARATSRHIQNTKAAVQHHGDAA